MKRNLKKLFIAVIMSLVLIAIQKSSVSALTVTSETLDEVEFTCNGVSTNQVFTFEDGSGTYLYAPTTVTAGSDYVEDSEIGDIAIGWIIKNVEDRQVAQAAIWNCNGYTVEAVNGDITQVYEVTMKARMYAAYYNSFELGYNSEDIEFSYSEDLDAYISNDFILSSSERIEFGSLPTNRYIQQYNSDSGEYETLSDTSSVSNGTFRFLYIRDGVTSNLLCDTMGIEYYYEYPIYLSATLYSSDDATAKFLRYSCASSVGTKFIGLPSLIGMYLDGDVNADGYINSTDAAIVLDCYKNNSATKKDYNLGDMNEDNILNSTDAAMILDKYKNS